MNRNVALAHSKNHQTTESGFSQIIKWHISEIMNIPVASRASATGERQPPAFHVA